MVNFAAKRNTIGPFIRGKIRRELYQLYEHVLSKTKTARIKVRVLFLFLTLFHLSVARSNGNQQGAKIFPPKINACVREGHLYEVFLVLAKTRLI